MNILCAFTRKSLLANRTRTIVTIVGIILSMALVTAVIEGAYSGQQFLLRSVEEDEGKWMISETGLNSEQAEALINTEGVGDSAVWNEVGWSMIAPDRTERGEKPYLLVESMSEWTEGLLPVRMLSGRMPENSGEIILPAIQYSASGISFEAGDTMTASFGRRVTDEGETVSISVPFMDSEGEGTETIVDQKERTYTVTGFYEPFKWDVDPYENPGILALTVGEEGNGNITVFCTLKNPAMTTRWLNDHPQMSERKVHNELRRYNGSFGNSSITTALYGFTGVLVFLVSFGSISLIYNSFSISVSERTKQFGILKSIGATKKQIRGSVLYEAFLLSLIGIPAGLVVGCAGIGLTLYLLRGAFDTMIKPGAETRIRMILNPGALLIAAVVSLLTTLISAAVPARLANRVSPIESIRQTDDVKIKAREVKTGRLTMKLFGFEGMMASKNFKRNRKRYRSTVVSLFLSVMLFISAASFCKYLTGSVGGVVGEDGGLDISYYSVGEERNYPEKTLEMLSSAGNTEDGTYMEYIYTDYRIPKEAATGEIKELQTADPGQGDEMLLWYGYITFLRDESFRELCINNGQDPADYFDHEHPKALVSNDSRVMREAKTGGDRYGIVSALLPEKIPCIISSVNRTLSDDSPEGVEEKVTEHYIGGIIKNPTFGTKVDGFTLFYPFSMEKEVLGDDADLVETLFCFRALNHAKAFADMENALAEAGMAKKRLTDRAAHYEANRMLVRVVNVFSYGFIVLISLIAVANVFNTISTNIMLRRREFAMLRSIGLGMRGFRRMMNYECIIYGMKGLIFGLPAAFVMTWVIWHVAGFAMEMDFSIPWLSVLVAVGSVFGVVFATMFYASAKLRKDNTVDALKNENL